MTAEPVLATINQIAATAETDTWTPTNLNDLPDQPPIRPTLGATGIVYPGKRHVFSGPPESAKTLAAYTILIQVARHGDTCILIDFEMGGYDARQRLQELGATPDEITRILYLEPDQPATPDRIHNLIAYNPVLVVVDAAAGAYQLEGLDDNKRGDVDQLSSLYVTLFWRNGVATILLDHVVKNSDDRGRFVIGSERKLGGADVHLGFETVKPVSRGSDGHYKIVTHKDRGGYLKRGHLADLRLDSDPDTNTITWAYTSPQTVDTDDGYFRPTHLMEKVSIHLELQPEPVTSNTICTALGGKKQYVHHAINALKREGFIDEQAGPNRARLLHTIRRYRENDETTIPENGSTMPREPHDLFSSMTTNPPKNDLAQPSGGSVVPSGSQVVPGTTHGGGGSVVPPLTGGPHPTTPPQTTQNDHGWFPTNNHLTDTHLAYLETVAPEDNNHNPTHDDDNLFT